MGLKDRSMILFMMYLVSTTYFMLLTTIRYEFDSFNILPKVHGNRVGPVPDTKPEPETKPSPDQTSQTPSLSKMLWIRNHHQGFCQYLS